MARKPITTAYMGSGPDKSNIIAIQKRFTHEAWDELLNIAFSATTSGATFTLPITWKEIKDNYAEVYVCVKASNDYNHTIIIPTAMIDKTNASDKFNLATDEEKHRMLVTLGGLLDKIGTIKSANNSNSSSRLIILAR
jgi:hypothetical protein